MKFSFLVLIVAMAFLLISCGGEELSLISIEDYISDNEIADVLETDSGLKYTIEFAGNDEKPSLTDAVNVKYKGYRTDDFVFDSAFRGSTFELGAVIAGWQEGIQLFGKGGKGVLYVPSELAYGSQPPSDDIPVNADLIFDIELLNWTKGESPLSLISVEDYISDNNIEVEETASGLMYTIEEAGTTEKPTLDDEVTVIYKGFRTDDFVFDSSASGATFSLSGVIAGWQEGIQLFGKGGKGVLYIPSELAYGSTSPSTDIPANADLIFEVELVDF